MKILLAWNVWDRYIDTLLGSEIVRLQNEEEKIFEQLVLVTQSGYPTPPSKEENAYVDLHVNVTVDEKHPLSLKHKKYAQVLRALYGIKTAYDAALKRDCDFAIVTNGDAWCLDLKKIKALLDDPRTGRCCFAARVGILTGGGLNFGAFAPYVDDHFMILNVRNCREAAVFDGPDEPKAFTSPLFMDYGGFHYMLFALIDELVPQGRFFAYTFLEDCVNHFGDYGGPNVLPWQYQPSFDFLHAKCFPEEGMNPLRAELLRHRGFSRYPAAAKYCREYAKTPLPFVRRDKHVVYRKPLGIKIRTAAARLRAEWQYRAALGDPRPGAPDSGEFRSEHPGDIRHYLDLYRRVLPAKALRYGVELPRN